METPQSLHIVVQWSAEHFIHTNGPILWESCADEISIPPLQGSLWLSQNMPRAPLQAGWRRAVATVSQHEVGREEEWRWWMLTRELQGGRMRKDGMGQERVVRGVGWADQAWEWCRISSTRTCHIVSSLLRLIYWHWSTWIFDSAGPSWPIAAADKYLQQADKCHII